MSNHCGSHMLNYVLKLLHERNFFDFLGREETEEFLRQIYDLGDDYDCNEGKIFKDIGKELGFCYLCWRYQDKLQDDVCKECKC